MEHPYPATRIGHLEDMIQYAGIFVEIGVEVEIMNTKLFEFTDPVLIELNNDFIFPSSFDLEFSHCFVFKQPVRSLHFF